MKKIIILAIAIVIASSMQAQLLYKITGQGIEKPSYIVGTHHLIDGSFADKIPGLSQALEEVNQVYGEIVMSDMQNPDTLQPLMAAMMLPEGKTLRDVLSKEQFEKLDQFFAENFGVKFSSDEIYSQMGTMTPTAISTQLTMMFSMIDLAGQYNPGNTIDQYFQVQALKAGKKVGGLESVRFQTSVLFGNKPIEEQVDDLMQYIEMADLSREINKELVEAYYAQDIRSIQTAFEESYELTENDQEEYVELLDKRNMKWIDLIPTIIKQEPTFIAVGVGHLLGEKGIIELLRAKGYTVEAVK